MSVTLYGIKNCEQLFSLCIEVRAQLSVDFRFSERA
jgi:hypothetical protein